MNNVVYFNMILEINQLLKENNIEYSIHGVGGCTCCGLELRQDGKSYSTENILEIINGSLKKSLDLCSRKQKSARISYSSFKI